MMISVVIVWIKYSDFTPVATPVQCRLVIYQLCNYPSFAMMISFFVKDSFWEMFCGRPSFWGYLCNVMLPTSFVWNFHLHLLVFISRWSLFSWDGPVHNKQYLTISNMAFIKLFFVDISTIEVIQCTVAGVDIIKKCQKTLLFFGVTHGCFFTQLKQENVALPYCTYCNHITIWSDPQTHCKSG